MSHSASDFIGSWKLLVWEIRYENGKITYPFGADAMGQILYAEDGHMSATVRRKERAGFSKPNPRDLTAEDKAGAFEEYFHYAGSWQIVGDTVVHMVTMSLNPNMTGSDQIRHAVFLKNGDLVLSADEAISENEKRYHALTWRRSR